MRPTVSTKVWQDTGAYFEYGRQRIFWREGGRINAPALLLIHGFPTSSWDWEAIWPQLETHYHLIAVDMLGFGFSAKPARHAYSIFEQADIHEALLKRCGICSYHVLAHDYGDTVAQELLARNLESTQAQSLKSICFLNGGLFPERHRLLTIQKLLLSPVGPLVARLSSKRRLDSSMRKIFGRESQPDAALIDGFWDLMTRECGVHAIAGVIRYIRERVSQRKRWVGALQNSALPLKLVDGMDDPISGAHMALRYRQLVPNADVTELHGIGHYPQIEAAEAVAAAYLEFRARLGDQDAQALRSNPD